MFSHFFIDPPASEALNSEAGFSVEKIFFMNRKKTQKKLKKVLDKGAGGVVK